jgi:hypothetical protein
MGLDAQLTGTASDAAGHQDGSWSNALMPDDQFPSAGASGEPGGLTAPDGRPGHPGGLHQALIQLGAKCQPRGTIRRAFHSAIPDDKRDSRPGDSGKPSITQKL